MSATIIRVAVPSPLNRLFDYLPALGGFDAMPAVGSRVSVPFGRSRKIGLVVELDDKSSVPAARLKAVDAVLDSRPLLSGDLVDLGLWAARYYHHAPGEVFAAMIPSRLRHGRPSAIEPPRCWSLTVAGGGAARSPPSRLGSRQRTVLELLESNPSGMTEAALRQAAGPCSGVLRSLEERGLIMPAEAAAQPSPPPAPLQTLPELTAAQLEAVNVVLGHPAGFAAYLLQGVTGSGKTEVYLRLAADALARGQQVLVLVPEIGLTPQLLRRFQQRFQVAIAAFHSGLGESERQRAWQAAAAGDAPIVIGTRSAIFTPLAQPGLIVVDEEHDPSLKQQDGFRYSGRDLAVVRASRLGIPVIMGSATPSLESLHNAETGRYRRLQLPERAGGARAPELELMDVRGQNMSAGISRALHERMSRHLLRGEQVLVFINRRGYAPSLLCHACGWVADCHRCDARLTLHQARDRLVCHHCASEQRPPTRCGQCGSEELRNVGQGTERIEQALAKRFPDYPVVRVDRDTTRRKGELEAVLRQIRNAEARILVGTQMLAKGHHFPMVTLVAVVDADQGLLSADYRAGERLAQLIVQVAGRAGRAEHPGHVVIQTHQPTHPLLQTMVGSGYAAFARGALQERREAALPPFASQALLRAEAVRPEEPMTFLNSAAACAQPVQGVELWGPVPAAMERKAGRWRAQLMINARTRRALQTFLDQWIPSVESLKQGRKVRWALDVDPLETL